MWNENSQVYQLDFGGRVTQESAKNFQIEFRGKQVRTFAAVICGRLFFSPQIAVTVDIINHHLVYFSLPLRPRLCNSDESMETLTRWTFSIRFRLCRPLASL